jgi:hypothetical protein
MGLILDKNLSGEEVKNEMKRLLVVGLALVMVFGSVVSALAFDTERIAVPAAQMQQIETSIGGMGAKDVCWIWMDQLSGWIWIFSATWFGPGCGFKKYVDPFDPLGYTDCLPPYFPFLVESMKIGVHIYNWGGPEYFPVTIYYDIETAVADPYHPCGFVPGPEQWRSLDLTYTLPPGFYGWFLLNDLSLVSHGMLPHCRWVTEPFFVSWHIVDVYMPGFFGWLTDFDGVTPCWNWLNAHCLYYYDVWLEFYDIGWTQGDLLFGVDGRPAWNVAVEMGSFEAVAGDQMVTLNWQSMSETNNANWTVKRDGEAIATLEGQGNKETPTDYEYVDRGLTNGQTYSYTVEAVNYEGNIDEYGPITATPLASGTVPGDFALSQNYPNPFNASTVIRYQLAADEHVTLKVYNIQGQEVASLVDTDQKAGSYSVHWTGEGVGSGVYFYTLSAGDFSETKKMVFTK